MSLFNIIDFTRLNNFYIKKQDNINESNKKENDKNKGVKKENDKNKGVKKENDYNDSNKT
jgi:hypothetical protein